MTKIIIAPRKFVLGAGELANLGNYVIAYGKNALLVASTSAHRRMKKILAVATQNHQLSIVAGNFNGECTDAEISRLRKICTQGNCDVIIGLGGGKAIDTAKTVADYEKKSVIIIPTIAATDAPCSSLAVIYTNQGTVDKYLFFRQNPDLVLVDSQIIAEAPVRFLIAGMGDALATYFEARSCMKAHKKNIAGGNCTIAALALAKLCYTTLLDKSAAAIAACNAQVVTVALEEIIEANILLSGLGFESGGLAAAHAIHNGLTALPETHAYYHGEKVAFGTIAQLVLENAPTAEISAVIAFCQSVGLPTCLADLGVKKITREKIMTVANAATALSETIHNTTFAVTAEMVAAAILAADKIGSN